MAHSVDKDYDLETILDTHRLGGGMLRDKAKAMLEDWLVELYPRMKSQQTPTSTLLEMGKVLIELGDMKARNIPVPTGNTAAFSISINLPAAPGRDAITVSAEVQSEQPLLTANFAQYTPATDMTVPNLSVLPPIPKHLKRIAVDNSSLLGD